MAIIAALAGGTGLGAVVERNRTMVGVAIAVAYAIGVAIGFAYLRRAKAAGACRVNYR